MEIRCQDKRAADVDVLAARPLSFDQPNAATLATLRRLFPALSARCGRV